MHFYLPTFLVLISLAACVWNPYEVKCILTEIEWNKIKKWLFQKESWLGFVDSRKSCRTVHNYIKNDGGNTRPLNQLLSDISQYVNKPKECECSHGVPGILRTWRLWARPLLIELCVLLLLNSFFHFQPVLVFSSSAKTFLRPVGRIVKIVKICVLC